MQITVQVDAPTAQHLQHHGPATAAARELHELAARLGVELHPLHPGVADPLLSSYFVITTDSEVVAETLLDKLRRCDAVEAAYIKPPDEAP